MVTLALEKFFHAQSQLATFTKQASLISEKIGSEFDYRLNIAKHANKLSKLSKTDDFIVKTLRHEGIFITSLEALSLPSTPAILTAVNSLVPDLPSTSHCDDERHVNSHVVHAHPSKIATDYPELFKWGLEERLLNIVENYIGVPVAYLGVNLRKDIPNGKQVGTRLWHKDGEDRRVLKVIIYLNDVSEQDGPFEYIPKHLTPSYKSFEHVHCKILDDDMNKVVPSLHWKQCTGKAGTVIFVDTASIFHHGKVPDTHRLALFFSYTSRRPKQPRICKTHFVTDKLLPLAQTLPQRQKECVLWHQQSS